MSRTMTSRSFVAAVLILTALLLAACGGKYEHTKVGPSSPEGRQILQMVETLRQGGLDALPEMLRQQAPDLTPSQLEAVKYLLTRMIEARSVELTALDRFGPQVYRGVFRLEEKEGAKSIPILLIAQDQKFYWAGPN